MFLQYKSSKVVERIDHAPLQHFQLWLLIPMIGMGEYGNV